MTPFLDDWAVERTIQTNGTLLDDEWAAFLAQNEILGVSLDGPCDLHDAYRHDGTGHSVFDRVEAAARLLQKHGAEFNVLCTMDAANAKPPLGRRPLLPRPARRTLPAVHPDRRGRDASRRRPGRHRDRAQCPTAAYGEFLGDLQRVVRHDVGEMFVQFFDGVLAAYLRGYSSLCVFAPRVAKAWRSIQWRRVLLRPLRRPAVSARQHHGDAARRARALRKQRAFGEAKRNTLPGYCRECEFLFACNGECPKNRMLLTPDGEPGLN